MLLIVTEYEPLLEQIGKEIEQGEEQTGAIPTRGTHPPTLTDQRPTATKKLTWEKDSTTFYRVLKALIESGCFGEIGKGKGKTSETFIIDRMNEIIEPTTTIKFNRFGFANCNLNVNDKEITQIIERLKEFDR